MKIANVFAILSLLLICSFSVASAQVEITSVEREVYAQYHDVDDASQTYSLQELSMEEGLFSHDLELAEGSALITSSQHTTVTSEATQFSIDGQMSAALVQTEVGYEDGLHSRVSMESFFSSVVFCDYSLTGIASGSCYVDLQIVDVLSGQEVAYESVSSGEFSLVGQIPPGDYFVTVWMWDAVYESDPVDRYSAVDFDLTIALEEVVASEVISLDAVRALYR